MDIVQCPVCGVPSDQPYPPSVWCFDCTVKELADQAFEDTDVQFPEVISTLRSL